MRTGPGNDDVGEGGDDVFHRFSFLRSDFIDVFGTRRRNQRLAAPDANPKVIRAVNIFSNRFFIGIKHT